MDATRSTSNNYIPPSQQYPSRPLVTGSIGIGLGIVASAIFASSAGVRIPVITRAIAPFSAILSNPIGRTATVIFAIASLAVGLENVFKGCRIISNEKYSNALKKFAKNCLKKTSDESVQKGIRDLAQSRPSSWHEVETLQTTMLQSMNLAPELNTKFPLRTESSIQITDYADTNCTVYKRNEINSKISVGFSDISGPEIAIQWGEIQNSGQTLILNAANCHLQGGGGVDGAINEKGGPIYVQNQQAVRNFSFNKDGASSSCYSIGYTPGHAVCIDSGPEFKLNGTQGVILVAAPNLDKKATTDKTQQISTKSEAPKVEQKNELYSCYFNSLTLADHFFTENPHLEPTFGLVCLGSGAFGWEPKTTRNIMKQALHNFYKINFDSELKVTVYLYYPDSKTENDRTKFVNQFTKDWEMEE